jgi:hypothetical protein
MVHELWEQHNYNEKKKKTSVAESHAMSNVTHFFKSPTNANRSL